MTEISVIIPFRDRIEWTKEAIQSVLAQTFQDFEIIVVDDGSQNQYGDQIQQLDQRIVYLRRDASGPAAARNTGIQASKGDFLAFLDSDDLFLVEKLDVQIRKMREYSDVMLSHTSYFLMDKEKTPLERKSSGLFTGNVYPDIYMDCPIATPTVILRRSAVFDRAFNEGVHIGEDVLLWARISQKSRILGIDMPLTMVRIHGHNAATNPEKSREGLKNLIRCGVLSDEEINPADRRRILSTLNIRVGHTYLSQRKFLWAIRYIAKGLIQKPSNSKIYVWILLKKILRR